MDAYTFWENHRALTNMRQSLIRQSFEATKLESSSSGGSRRPVSARDSSLSPRRLTPRMGLALDGLPANRLDAYPRSPRSSSARGSRTATFATLTSSAATKPTPLDPYADGAGAAAMAQQAAPLAVPTQAAPVPSGLAHKLPAGVTMSELQAAHQVIKEHLLNKHGNYQRAFLSIDKDHDKFITRRSSTGPYSTSTSTAFASRSSRGSYSSSTSLTTTALTRLTSSMRSLHASSRWTTSFTWCLATPDTCRHPRIRIATRAATSTGGRRRWSSSNQAARSRAMSYAART